MKSYLMSLRVLLCIAFLCAACGLNCKSETPVQPEPEPPEAKQTQPPTEVKPVEPKPPVETVTKVDQNETAVTVNGTKITEGRIEAMINKQLERMAAQGKQMPPQFANQYKKMLRKPMLEQLIAEQLMNAKIKEANITVTDKDVLDQIEENAQALSPPLTLEEFKAKMAQYGRDFEKIKQQTKKGLPYQRLIEKEGGDKVKVVEEDARKYYDENSKNFQQSELVNARHILIIPDMSDPNADPNEAKAKAKAKTEDLLKKIKEGADFAELAKANSADPSSAEKGGELGFFPKNRMEPPFEKAAFALKEGQVSDIVETTYGFHIIKFIAHKEAGVTPFDEVKENIIQRLTRQKQAEFAKEFIEKLKAEAKIDYPPGKEPKPAQPPMPPSTTPAPPTPR